MAPLLDICHALDPVAFARERLNFQPDSKQALVLASRSKQVILNCTRQWGKSTLTALFCTQGAQLITDDLLRLQPDGSGWRCLPGTGEIRLRPGVAVLATAFAATVPGTTPDGRTALTLAMDRSRPPLGAIVLPRPSHRCQRLHLERLVPTQALLALMTSPRVQGLQPPEYLQHRLDACARLAAGVPVFQAAIPWGPPFPQELAAALVREVGLAGPQEVSP